MIETYGLGLLFLLVMLESAGVPLPGETALIGASILASQGHFDIVAVIAVAAAAAILGDNGGYWVGRKWGRRILGRWTWLERISRRAEALAERSAGRRSLATLPARSAVVLLHFAFARAVAVNHLVERTSERILPPSERFFAKHGPKTVFIGRFVAILRFTAAWMAGVSHMTWWRFLAWNAFGGVAWAALVALIAYYAGRAAADAVSHYGLIVGLPIIAVAVLAIGGFHIWKRRMLEAARDEG